MPITSVELRTSASPPAAITFDPELSLEEVLEELQEWPVATPGAAPCRIDARVALADATVLAAVAALAKQPVHTVLMVRSEAVRARVLRSIPGSGGRLEVPLPDGRTLVISEGDLLSVPVDAVVNASNDRLRLGQGVSGAIRQAARPSLQEALDRLFVAEGPLRSGRAVWTGAHGIRHLRGLIHVNAIAGTAEAVEHGSLAAIHLAHTRGLASIALPLLGTGTGALPVEEGLAAMFRALTQWSVEGSGSLQRIWLVLWSDPVYYAAVKAIPTALRPS